MNFTYVNIQDIPKRAYNGRPSGETVQILKQFLSTEAEAVAIQVGSGKGASKRKINSEVAKYRTAIKRNNLPIKAILRESTLYLIREEVASNV